MCSPTSCLPAGHPPTAPHRSVDRGAFSPALLSALACELLSLVLHARCRRWCLDGRCCYSWCTGGLSLLFRSHFCRFVDPTRNSACRGWSLWDCKVWDRRWLRKSRHQKFPGNTSGNATEETATPWPPHDMADTKRYVSVAELARMGCVPDDIDVPLVLVFKMVSDNGANIKAAWNHGGRWVSCFDHSLELCTLPVTWVQKHANGSDVIPKDSVAEAYAHGRGKVGSSATSTSRRLPRLTSTHASRRAASRRRRSIRM